MSDPDRCSVNRQEGAGAPGAAESPRHPSLVYTVPSYSDTADEREECRSLSHLGILMPLYLLPLLFLGTKYGGCLYCLLLPLLLWAFNSLPKPGAALVHMITVPLMGLMGPEQIARQYMSVEALTLALMLSLVVVIDRWSDLALHLALNVSKRFGLCRGKLFAAMCLCCFVCASLFSGVVVSTALLYMINRVLMTIFKEDMDWPQELAVPPTSVIRGGSAQGSLQETSSMRSGVVTGDQVLYEKLTHVVLSMKQPVSTSQTPTTVPQAAQASTASLPKELQEAEEGALSAKRRFSHWRQLWHRKQSVATPQIPVTQLAPAQEKVEPCNGAAGKPANSVTKLVTTADGARHADAAAVRAGTSSTETGTRASTCEAPNALHRLVRVDLTDEEGAFNPMTPFAVRKKKESLEYQHKLDTQRHVGATTGLRRGYVPRMSQSTGAGSLNKKQEQESQGNALSLLFRWHSSRFRRESKGSEVSSSTIKGKKRSRVIGSLGAIADFFTGRHFSETQPRHTYEENVHAADQHATSTILPAVVKPPVAGSEAKPNADKSAMMNVKSLARRVGASVENRASSSDIRTELQDPATSKTSGDQSCHPVSVVVSGPAITNAMRAKEARGPPVAATQANPNDAVNATAHAAVAVTATNTVSVSLEDSSVRPTRRAREKGVANSRRPTMGDNVQDAASVVTKLHVQASDSDGRREENAADDQSGEKPANEETCKGSREASGHAAAAADVTAAKDKLQDETKTSHLTEPRDKEVHSRSRTSKDKTEAKKKSKRSGKRSRDSASESRRQSLHSKSRASVSHDTPQQERQAQSERSSPAIPSQGSLTKPSSPVSNKDQGKPDSDSRSDSVLATESEQLGAAASGATRRSQTEGLEPRQLPALSDCSKVSASSGNESGRESVRLQQMSSAESGRPRDMSRQSKTPVRRRQRTGPQATKSRAKEAKQPSIATNGLPDSKVTTDRRKPSEEESPVQVRKEDAQKQTQSREIPKAPEITTAGEGEKVLGATKSNEPDEAAVFTSALREKGSKSTTIETPQVQSLQRAPSVGSVSVRNSQRPSRPSLQTRKQSVVSFGSGIKGAVDAYYPEESPQVPKALAHLQEMAPKPLTRKSVSTILKVSSSATVPRGEPSVDFGKAHFTLIRFVLNGASHIHRG